MRAQRQPFHRDAPRRNFVGVAVLVICALLLHSFDNCTAHLGGFSSAAAQSHQIAFSCSNGTAPCAICETRQHEPHQDLCDLVSETAVLTSSQHPIDYHSVQLPATVAVVPATPQLIALSGCLHGSAEPPPTPFLTSSLRASLPNRAPPISA